MATSQNCWESLNCKDKEKCPAYPSFGKTCFSIEGTLCMGTKQGKYLEKANQCRDKCPFYKQIFSK